MSRLTLGLDVGCHSIGWALLDEDGAKIIALGVRVFPEGVDRDQQGGEKSKSQSRREARGMRRQLRRRARRRAQLRHALTGAGLLPEDADAFRRVMDANPYVLRRKALTERLEPWEIGRVLFHLGQRRGYLPNRKTDKPKDKDQKGMLGEIEGLAGTLKETGNTLGQFLADLSEHPEYGKDLSLGRIRERHTRRDMYQDEFERIWEAQRAHYPDLLTDQLKYGRRGKQSFPKVPNRLGKGGDVLAEFGLHGLLYFQRKMYPPKSVVGRCELERREKRCRRAARIAQRFRIVQEVNNLRVLDYAKRKDARFLTEDERRTLIEYLSDGRERTFEQLRKKLHLPETARFNLQRGERKKLQGHQTDAALAGKNGVGKRWKALADETKDAIVDILVEEADPALVVHRLQEESGLSADEAERASRVNLPDGYMSFSRVAMRKLLPPMERGLMLMGEDATNSALHAAGYLRPDEQQVNQRRLLPPAPDLTNPIVRQAVIEVRRVVNAVLREHVHRGGHVLGRIHVELAREAKKSFEQRKELRFDQAKRRDAREAATRAIEEFDPQVRPSRAAVNRYLLWREQGESCVYCGQKVSIAQLFNGDTDVDHILPRWRSLDDSMGNKVLCHRACNDEKGDRTPREWLESTDPARFEEVLQAAARLPYGKQQRFLQEDIRLDDFVARQLTDTAYISRCVSQYLRCLGATVRCARGDMTSELRHRWGLNNILDPSQENRKNRDDHRHHAVDAIALALMDDKRLFALANARGKNVPLPWAGFREEATAAVRAVNVSHRPQRGIRGPLHKDTIYGTTQKSETSGTTSIDGERPWAKDWVENANTFVRRKPVTDITNAKQLAKVRDPAIRRILEEHLRKELGIDPTAPGKFPKDAFAGANTPRMPSGVPIKRVRMLEKSQTIRQVSKRRSFQFVNPGSNHHIVYRAVRKRGKEVWTAEVLTMFDAAARGLARFPLIDTSDGPKGRFIMSLSIGEAFQIDGDDGHPVLCVVRKVRQDNNRLFFKLHTDARETKEVDKDDLSLPPSRMQQRNARKVTVDAVGRVRWADGRYWRGRGQADNSDEG